MKVRYDLCGDIFYIEVFSGKVVEIVEIDDDFLVDYDEKGNIVGIEIWCVWEVFFWGDV